MYRSIEILVKCDQDGDNIYVWDVHDGRMIGLGGSAPHPIMRAVDGVCRSPSDHIGRKLQDASVLLNRMSHGGSWTRGQISTVYMGIYAKIKVVIFTAVRCSVIHVIVMNI